MLPVPGSRHDDAVVVGDRGPARHNEIESALAALNGAISVVLILHSRPA